MHLIRIPLLHILPALHPCRWSGYHSYSTLHSTLASNQDTTAILPALHPCRWSGYHSYSTLHSTFASGQDTTAVQPYTPLLHLIRIPLLFYLQSTPADGQDTITILPFTPPLYLIRIPLLFYLHPTPASDQDLHETCGKLPLIKSLRSLYFALVHSHLLYSPIIINLMSQTNINSIAKLQKRAIRVMTKSAYNAHTEPIFLQNKNFTI